MATKQQLEQRIADLESDLDDADARISELEDTISGIGEQADGVLSEDESSEEDDSD